MARPIGAKERDGILRDALAEVREHGAEVEQRFAQSLVNYAAAPIGSKKYDSNWLASNTAAR